MAFIPLVNVPIQIMDSNGDPVSGGTINAYLAGTTTPTNLFSDSSGTVIGSSVSTNSSGYPAVGGNVVTLFRQSGLAYKIIAKNSAGTTLWSSDGIGSVSYFDSTASTKLDSIEAGADVTDRDNISTYVLGQQHLWIPASQMYLPTTSPAGALTLVEGTAGLPNYYGYPFDGSTEEHVQFTWAYPGRWDKSDIKVKIAWSTAGTDADGVVWRIRGVALNDGDDIAQSWGSSYRIQDDMQSAAGKMLWSRDSGYVTVGGTPLDDGIVIFDLYRDPAAGDDTADEDAVMIGLRLEYSSDWLNDD